MLHSQLFLFYFVVFHLQHVHCTAKIFAHLLKCNLKFQLADEQQQAESAVKPPGSEWGQRWWVAVRHFSGGSYDGYLETGERNRAEMMTCGY